MPGKMSGSTELAASDLPGEAQLDEVAVRLHDEDNVAVAKASLPAGMVLILDPDRQQEGRFSLRQAVPGGHKVALCVIRAGEPVRRYGEVIGLASRGILPGEHVHTHNVGLQDFARQGALGPGQRPVTPIPEAQRRTFLGYRRGSGRAGTRNYLAVISTVGCSAHVAREIVRHFDHEGLAEYANVDGVAAFTHQSGCTFRPGGQDHVLLRRTLAGIARHPNVGAYVLVGLGCEANQIDDLVACCDLCLPDGAALVIQEQGGTQKTVEAGIAAVEAMLPELNTARRSPQPLSELALALQCGGSDGWSGVTANPAVGLVADEVVRQGGTVVLAETPEIYGAEHLLARRAVSAEVAHKLLAQVDWWKQHTRRIGMLVDDNRGVGNEAGGLTTIYEKSLGGVIKAGSSPLVDVYDYAEPVTARGFVFMNSPGNDPVSVTGQVAGGCNLVLFTTGRGSVFGFKPAPTIKIASNSGLFRRMEGDMDLDAGRVLEGASLGASVRDVADDLLDLVVAVASGQPSRSEALGIGEAEFCPWNLGGIL